MNKIHVLALTMLLYPSSFLCQDEWKFKKEKYEIRAFTRPHPDYNIHEYKVETKLSTSIADIISVMMEESSYLKIFKDLKDIKFYNKSDNHLELFLVNKAPFPTRYRDGYFISEFSYDPIKKTARIDITCPSTKYHNKKYIEITRCQGFWEFYQKEENIVNLTHQFVADPGGFLPGFILNIFLVNNPINTVRDLKIILKKGNYQKKEFKFLTNK
ncbi:MAG: hypothetical protein V3V00_03400 [Saprospiraceae bacterium]